MHRSRTIPGFSPVYLTLFVFAMPWMLLQAQTILVSESTVTNKFYSASGKWTKASNTNCLIWNSFPRDGDSATWSGAVVDEKAHGKGVVQWFTNGIPTTSYEGEMKQGLMHGHGIAKGYGYTTEGEFKNGSLVSTTMTCHYPNGGWYKGEHRGGFKDGEGEELMKGGVRYVGHFKRDRFEGKGALIWPNGDKITGWWMNSRLLGRGLCTRTNGDSFEVKMTGNRITRY